MALQAEHDEREAAIKAAHEAQIAENAEIAAALMEANDKVRNVTWPLGKAKNYDGTSAKVS